MSHHTVTLPSEQNSKERKEETAGKGTERARGDGENLTVAHFAKTQGFKEKRIMIATNKQIKINQTSLLSSSD